MWYIPFFPEEASTSGGQVDLLFVAITALTILFTVMVAGLVIFFSIKYRHTVAANRAGGATMFGNLKLELAWIFIPLMLGTLIFLWSAGLFFNLYSPPQNAQEIYVTGKQWMWKVQHPSGRREINELHVPIGQPIKLVMTSQDVIHDFFVPAFRIKMDVLPGRFTEQWFEADKVGEYHIFCAEYCGLDHSRMVGKVVVMDRADYEQWLQGGNAVTGGGSGDLADQGEETFNTLGCVGCHRPDNPVAPDLAGVYGSEEELADGSTVLVDDNYVVQSILDPNGQVVAGYQPIMPSYQGQISQDELLGIVAYLKSIGSTGGVDVDNAGSEGETENEGSEEGEGGSNNNNQGGSNTNNQGGSNNQNQPTATPGN